MTDAKAMKWYQTGFDKLQPLQWHLHELLMEMEFHNAYAKRMKEPLLNRRKMAAARRALNRAEKFFTGRTLR